MGEEEQKFNEYIAKLAGDGRGQFEILAVTLHESFVAFLSAGFNDQQALELTKALIGANR